MATKAKRKAARDKRRRAAAAAGGVAVTGYGTGSGGATMVVPDRAGREGAPLAGGKGAATADAPTPAPERARTRKHGPGRAQRKGSSPGRATPRRSQHERYTPPTPKTAKKSPPWMGWVIIALFLLGVIVIILNYADVLPGGVNDWWLVGAIASIFAGLMAATRYR